MLDKLALFQIIIIRIVTKLFEIVETVNSFFETQSTRVVLSQMKI